jgi:hypothetical protein
MLVGVANIIKNYFTMVGNMSSANKHLKIDSNGKVGKCKYKVLYFRGKAIYMKHVVRFIWTGGTPMKDK